MKITVNGQVHDFEWSTVTLNEGIKIQERTDLLYAEFRAALSDKRSNMLAWKAFCALLVERTTPEPVNWDGFNAVWDDVTVEQAADASDPSSVLVVDVVPQLTT